MSPTSSLALVGVLFGSLAAFSLYWTFELAAQGRWPSMLVVLGFAVFAIAVLVLRIVVTLGKVAPRIQIVDGATELRPGILVDRLSMTGALAAFAALLVYGVGGLFGVAGLPGVAADRTWLPLVGIIGAVIGVPSLIRMIRQGGMGYVRLSAEGVDVADAYFRAARRWDELTDVSDRSAQSNWFQTSGATYLTTADGHTRTWASDWYTPGGRAAREFVRFYWQHPEHRDELTDSRAARRLEAMT
ncbi:hypothetical protein ACAG25_11220 [Mycobacterium sp. pV006]|uniref:hypothetical protein n=1 Tax=Mycobacterium sp. pV006 TaxID=3238983 RepID=UPI00351B06E9